MASAVEPPALRAGDLPGWRAVAGVPGIGVLAPSTAGLTVTGRSDALPLVRAGDVVRAERIVFARERDAVEAAKRGAGDDYANGLERLLRGSVTAREPGSGWKLTVPRPTGGGADTVELLVRRRGMSVIVVELVSAAGFRRALRDRILALATR